MIFFPVVNLSSDLAPDRESCASEDDDSGSPGWRSFAFPFSQDVAKAMTAAANAVSPSRPSVVFSSEDDGCSSPLKRLQDQVSRALKGFSKTSGRRSVTYNPEVLTSQKRQWASFQLQSLDHRSLEEPSKLFENMVVVGLHPSFDVQVLRKWLTTRRSELSGKLRFTLGGRNRPLVEPNSEPQVLFNFPPEKELPLNYRDLLSFCFPSGLEVHAIEKNSSMSDLNQLLLGQEHLKKSELSFVFRLQIPDSSPLYGCCVLVEERLDKPSRLISTIADSQSANSRLERYIFTTRRCYCILSRLPFFDLHFGVLNRIFMEERLGCLTRSNSILNLEMLHTIDKVEGLQEIDAALLEKHLSEDEMNSETSPSSFSTASAGVADIGSHAIYSSFIKDNDSIASTNYESDKEPTVVQPNSEASNLDTDGPAMSATMLKCLPGDNDTGLLVQHASTDEMNEQNETSPSSFSEVTASAGVTDITSNVTLSDPERKSSSFGKDTDSITSTNDERNAPIPDREPTVAQPNSEASNFDMDCSTMSATMEKCLPGGNDSGLFGKHVSEDEMNETNETSPSNHAIHSDPERKDTSSVASASYERNALIPDKEPIVAQTNSEVDGSAVIATMEKCLRGGVDPLPQNQSSSGFPCERRHPRSDNDEADTEEPSTSGKEDFISHNDMLEWAKENNIGSLQVVCEYYKLDCPSRDSTITFHPLEHLHPLEFHRPAERFPPISGSPPNLSSCKTNLERAEVLNAIIAEEEATTLSVWAISCICGCLKLENVLALFAGALLEKQIVFVCSNLGVLSASVLSVIPLIRPYEWQSLLMPVLPNDMLDFLDAPVPYIVGVQTKASEVQSKLTNGIMVDVGKNQVRSPSMPQLPKERELFMSLVPYHSRLVGKSSLGRKQPIFECTDEQVEAANGFMEVIRNYLDSLCSAIRAHTITNVQSNDDKVSLLLKESFIDSFPICDRPFMKCFVDTQLFSVHTDLVLSVYQKD